MIKGSLGWTAPQIRTPEQGQLPYQAEDLVLEGLGLALQGLDALGRGLKGPCGHAVFDTVGGAVAQVSATRDLCRSGQGATSSLRKFSSRITAGEESGSRVAPFAGYGKLSGVQAESTVNRECGHHLRPVVSSSTGSSRHAAASAGLAGAPSHTT